MADSKQRPIILCAIVYSRVFSAFFVRGSANVRARNGFGSVLSAEERHDEEFLAQHHGDTAVHSALDKMGMS
jgi:hypothetical protein